MGVGGKKKLRYACDEACSPPRYILEFEAKALSIILHTVTSILEIFRNVSVTLCQSK